jgi:TRAP-type transport system periplasmic protein
VKTLAKMVATLVGAAALSLGSAQTYTLQLGHGAQDSHPTQLGAERVAELVAERSDGRLRLEVFPNRQLGEERELVEGLQLGTVDIAVVSTGPLGGFVPRINVVDLPFLFRDAEHAYAVFDGPIGDDLLAEFETIGIKGVAFWENGWRHLTSKRRVAVPSDLQGVKIRTMENEVHMDAFSALGAGPVPMVWGEVYTSLQQGVIDAQENPITVIYTNALWEVQDYVHLTGHVYGPHLVLVSQLSLARLPEDLQEILIDAIREVSSYQRQQAAELEAEMSILLQEQGMEILEVDTEPFRDATAAVLERYAGRFGDGLIEEIQAVGQD